MTCTGMRSFIGFRRAIPLLEPNVISKSNEYLLETYAEKNEGKREKFSGRTVIIEAAASNSASSEVPTRGDCQLSLNAGDID